MRTSYIIGGKEQEVVCCDICDMEISKGEGVYSIEKGEENCKSCMLEELNLTYGENTGEEIEEELKAYEDSIVK